MNYLRTGGHCTRAVRGAILQVRFALEHQNCKNDVKVELCALLFEGTGLMVEIWCFLFRHQ